MIRWSFFPSLWFWCVVAFQTFASRRFPRVLASRMRGRPIVASGEEHVPRAGGFVFCVNHYHAGLTFDVVSATLLAATRTRPRVADECAVVVGHRVRNAPRWPSRALSWIASRVFARWSTNILRIRTRPADAGPVGIAELRTWRRRALSGPTLVFPEGIANRELGGMRAGVGRWLSSLDIPVIPVAVWWGGADWNVTFGAPLAWSPRQDLRDLQLGLAIADLLPVDLTPAWSELLEQWRAAHKGNCARLCA